MAAKKAKGTGKKTTRKKSAKSNATKSKQPGAQKSAKPNYTIAAKIEKAQAEGVKKQSEAMENFIAILVVVSLCVFVWLLATGTFKSKEIPPEDIVRYQVSIDDDPMLGDNMAPVTIIEFSDYLCPACAHFQESIFPLLKEQYIDTGKARFIYRDYPLEELHNGTVNVAAIATCAEKQDRFWEFHDALYANQGALTESFINETATSFGMNLDALNACRSSGKAQEEARFDRQDGLRTGEVTATPTFFVNGQKLIGPTWGKLQEVIDEELTYKGVTTE